MPKSKTNVDTTVRRYLRDEAAQYIAEQTGVPMNRRSLEYFDVPYRVIHGRCVYEEPDLDRRVAQMLGAATRRRPARAASKRSAYSAVETPRAS